MVQEALGRVRQLREMVRETQHRWPAERQEQDVTLLVHRFCSHVGMSDIDCSAYTYVLD